MRYDGRNAGFSLIEAMIAMGVLLVAGVGLLTLHGVGVRLTTDGRVMTRATAVAQDLMDQMQLWDFANDPRLVNVTTSNDSDITDSTDSFEQPVGSFTFDHQESELETQGATYPWLGVSSAKARSFGLTRYWNVAEVDYDPSGVLNAKRVAVIVRWEKDGIGRRIVFVTVLRNPAAN